MSTFDDDLLAALRRSTDPADRRLADLLGTLSPTGDRATTGPRANEALTSFLVGADPAVARLTDPVPGPEPDLVVALGRPSPRRRSMRSGVLVPFHKVLKMGLLAKVMLGATVAFTGAGAVAATGGLPGGDNDVVVVTPASDGTDVSDDSTEVSDAVEVEDDHEGAAHEGDVDDGPDPEDVDDDADDAEDADEADEVEDARETDVAEVEDDAQDDDSDDDSADDTDDDADDADDETDGAEDEADDAEDEADDADEPDDDTDGADDADDAEDEADDADEPDDDADEPEDD
ncbi:MAG TPA: hypothetical protein VF227_05710 [Actinomycetes bacterium]